MARLHVQREHYEEAMKKSFMRGVCALNMEAMSMFHGDEGAGKRKSSGSLEGTTHLRESLFVCLLDLCCCGDHSLFGALRADCRIYAI